ncbi:SDR family oxidoreductase [Oceanobacter mangrovi]|uniref:SDR family oxidoreductase n=1 Tax=Oceanobacter mangrovi TaxID=2862510 RepID=UPI001C8DCAED|nr:SDR family oxidoreductase [Oceanobacter mangrovi]
MIAVTGASGQLGRLVITELLKTIAAGDIVALVRDPQKVADLTELGVQVRQADYNQPDSLAAAFAGVDKVLLISSSEVGQRLPQHRNVIEALKGTAISLLAYTSILKADTSPLPLALEHQQTEKLLAESGLPYALLRNGWYTENYTAGVPAALQLQAVYGCAGDGKIASAARADYAAAAAAVLTSTEAQAGKVYELAGDEAYTLTELAAAISSQSGQQIPYVNVPEADYQQALVQAGLPEPIADLLAESDTGASKGGLFDDSHTLSQLIGRPTTALAELVKQAL